ncbi:hypothetical protein CWC39_04460 [Corynebacterium heidelbergense]|uniref:Uncharacterized protein n=1 Tax=Corynebacterium heidelbergense TaxID=2055947 RepID=A0A364VC32_9CORY|nr:hypothetical protein CWC39_04460 [Corynebacterium heidelbergense]
MDCRGRDGQFIFTGSSVPSDDIARRTGAGRFVRVRQRTMTWFERGLSSGAVSLSALFDSSSVTPSTERLEYGAILERLCVSGFPAHIHRNPADSQIVMNAYAQEVSRADLHRIAASQDRGAGPLQ